MVFVDKRRQPGMITIVDLFGAVEDFHLEDLYETTRRIDKTADEGYVPGPIVLLSFSNGIHILVSTLMLLPSRVPFRMRAFHTLEDAVISLGMSGWREQIIQFWNECNSVCEPA